MKVNTIVDAVSEYAYGSLSRLWPAFGNNPATESNIRTALTAVLSPLGYCCYSELPFQTEKGTMRVDFGAIQ
ncbi:hypothetical protein LCGC14_2321920, partial [marine sediment metagenome]